MLTVTLLGSDLTKWDNRSDKKSKNITAVSARDGPGLGPSMGWVGLG